MTTKETRSPIRAVTVSSRYPFIVYGPCRGLISQHRSERAAFRSLDDDQEGCAARQGFSDAAVYMAREGEWVPCQDFWEDF